MPLYLLILIWVTLPKFSKQLNFCNYNCGERNYTLCETFNWTNISEDIWEILKFNQSWSSPLCEISSKNVEINQGATIYQKFEDLNENNCTSGEIRTRSDDYGAGRWCIDVTISPNPISVIGIFRMNHF